LKPKRLKSPDFGVIDSQTEKKGADQCAGSNENRHKPEISACPEVSMSEGKIDHSNH
jgi:hypothetical protein